MVPDFQHLRARTACPTAGPDAGQRRQPDPHFAALGPCRCSPRAAAELSDREGIHIYPAEADEVIEPLDANPLLALVHEHLREQLGPKTRMTLQRNGENALFVSFRIDDETPNTGAGESEGDGEFWVALPRERIERRFPHQLDRLGRRRVVALLGRCLADRLSHHPAAEGASSVPHKKSVLARRRHRWPNMARRKWLRWRKPSTT